MPDDDVEVTKTISMELYNELIQEPEGVTISKTEYNNLLDAQDFLDFLHNAGVGNWEGYDIALELYEEQKK